MSASMSNVFISHRRADAQAAEKLAHEIKKAGHHVWLDDWEINVGDSILGRMQEGLQAACYLVLCYSDQGVTAPWISREWMSALATQMNTASVKVLPVVLTGGGPPAILSDIKYANLTANWQAGVEEILRAIR
jgi:hypothetical protein